MLHNPIAKAKLVARSQRKLPAFHEALASGGIVQHSPEWQHGHDRGHDLTPSRAKPRRVLRRARNFDSQVLGGRLQTTIAKLAVSFLQHF